MISNYFSIISFIILYNKDNNIATIRDDSLEAEKRKMLTPDTFLLIFYKFFF